MKATAVRTWKNGKATVMVTKPDGKTKAVGGNRAARAAVVVLYVDPRGEGPHWRVLGVRQDPDAGYAEARRLAASEWYGSWKGYESETLVVDVVDE